MTPERIEELRKRIANHPQFCAKKELDELCAALSASPRDGSEIKVPPPEGSGEPMTKSELLDRVWQCAQVYGDACRENASDEIQELRWCSLRDSVLELRASGSGTAPAGSKASVSSAPAPQQDAVLVLRKDVKRILDNIDPVTPNTVTAEIWLGIATRLRSALAVAPAPAGTAEDTATRFNELREAIAWWQGDNWIQLCTPGGKYGPAREAGEDFTSFLIRSFLARVAPSSAAPPENTK